MHSAQIMACTSLGEMWMDFLIHLWLFKIIDIFDKMNAIIILVSDQISMQCPSLYVCICLRCFWINFAPPVYVVQFCMNWQRFCHVDAISSHFAKCYCMEMKSNIDFILAAKLQTNFIIQIKCLIMPSSNLWNEIALIVL